MEPQISCATNSCDILTVTRDGGGAAHALTSLRCSVPHTPAPLYRSCRPAGRTELRPRCCAPSATGVTARARHTSQSPRAPVDTEAAAGVGRGGGSGGGTWPRARVGQRSVRSGCRRPLRATAPGEGCPGARTTSSLKARARSPA